MEITLLSEADLPFLNEIRNECSNEFLHDSRTFTLEEIPVGRYNILFSYFGGN